MVHPHPASHSALRTKACIPHRFTERLAPWVHYVPIQSDYSDLYDTLVFFRGDLAGRGAHEELAAKIAKEGREWSLAFWREEDMVAYLFRCVSGVFVGRSRLTAAFFQAVPRVWEGDERGPSRA